MTCHMKRIAHFLDFGALDSFARFDTVLFESALDFGCFCWVRGPICGYHCSFFVSFIKKMHEIAPFEIYIKVRRVQIK